MAAATALRQMGRHDLAATTEAQQVQFDFDELFPEEVELHCASKRNDLPRGVTEKWSIQYCAYCAVFHNYEEAFTQDAHNYDIAERYCKQWSNPRSREIFCEQNGGTLYPTMKTTGTGNILEIAKDRRWAFTLVNVPGDRSCVRTDRLVALVPC